MRISAGQAVKYAIMPGILPRVKEILLSGFGPVTRLIALICFMVGLLPKTHPCFARKNRNDYGLVKILAAAGHNVRFEWKHIDQVLIYFAIVCGSMMTMLYLAGMVMFFVVSPVHAMGLPAAGLFTTANPGDDMAFMMLDRVLGIPGIFNSNIPAGMTFPNNFHLGLQALFQFYSMAIFFIALAIFLYYIVEIVYEIQDKGNALDPLSDGDDDHKGIGWIPLRLIIAFGLILPVSNGLNSGQWITLYVAKFGSGMATNAWIAYNTQVGNNPTGERNINLVAKPNEPDASGLIKSLLVMRSCNAINAMGYVRISDKQYGYNVKPYVVNGNNRLALVTDDASMPAIVPPGGSYSANSKKVATRDGSDPFVKVLQFSGYSDIHIVLGTYDKDSPQRFKDYDGGVLPVCGEITVPVTGNTPQALFATEGYFFAILNILFDINRPSISMTDKELNLFVAVIREFNRTSALVKNYLTVTRGAAGAGGNPNCYYDTDNDGFESVAGDTGDYLGRCTDAIPSSYWKTMMTDFYSDVFDVPSMAAYDFLAGTDTAMQNDNDVYAIGNTAYTAVGVDDPFLITPGILKYGWGGAGLWYNKISQLNGSLYTAVSSLPMAKKYPLVMENIKKTRKASDTNQSESFCQNYNPAKSGVSSTPNSSEKNQFDAEQAEGLYRLCVQLFENEGVFDEGTTKTTALTNVVDGVIRSIFPELKAYDIYKNSVVTPLVQLSSIGRMLVDRALLGIVTSTGLSFVGGMMQMASAGGATAGSALAGVSGLLSSTIMTFAMMGLLGGIMLHYIVPFMPFVYFFLAVGRWVKVVFEALVGIPLWGLAHMHRGGPGLPGEKALDGYFLILEIFIRPILTVFSLIGAFAIFSAMVVALNETFTVVTVNLFGAPPSLTPDQSLMDAARGTIDQFFLSLLYIIFVYMCGTGAFKLIDLIPDGIMHWSSSGVQGMGAADISDDLHDNWQWELPTRMQATLGELGSLPRELFSEPAEKMAEAAAAEAAAKKKAEAERKKMTEEQAKEASAQAAKSKTLSDQEEKNKQAAKHQNINPSS